MSDIWVQAANCGRTLWLQELLQRRLPELDSENVSYQDWFEQMLEAMEQRGLVKPYKGRFFTKG